MRKLIALFDSVWLPLFLIAGTSWLFAPWLHHEHFGHLQLISSYEGINKSFAWLFRTGDLLFSVLIVLSVWRAKLWRLQPILTPLLLVIAVLAAIDALFVIGCYTGCSTWQIVSHHIHDVESTWSVIVIAAAIGFDGFYNRSLPSRLFFGLQILAGVVVALAIFDRQVLAFMQFLYQVSVVAWLGYVLRRYMPNPIRKLSEKDARTLFAVLLAIAGCFVLLTAFHMRSYGSIPGGIQKYTRGEPLWLVQHSLLAGATMLYLARQLRQGQRRAAWLVTAVLISLAVKYALITPDVYGLALCETLLLLLLLNWHAFNRNLGLPPLVSRLKSLWILLVGIVAAWCVLVFVAQLSGRLPILLSDTKHVFSNSANELNPLAEGDFRAAHRIERLRLASTSLAAIILLALLWTFFQPSNNLFQRRNLSQREVEDILARYATSSEDFFKLWPEDKQYFTRNDIDGFIAYKKIGRVVFALAGPIGPSEHRAMLVQAFVTDCRSHGWTACFLIVNEGDRTLYESANLKLLHIGSSAVISIQEFIAKTLNDKWWRWQKNRAAKEGVRYVVSEPPHSRRTIAEAKEVSDNWLLRPGRREQGFALGYFDADYLDRCRLHMLRDSNGRLIAFTNELPVFNHLPQTTVDMLRADSDHPGAMPVLIARMLEKIAQENIYTSFDLGFVPLAKVETKIAAVVRFLAASRYSAAGLEQFKGKFKPEWHAQYLAYDGDTIDLTLLVSRLEKAMKP